MTDSGADNLRWAYALLDGLVAAGVRRLVISPGSRNTPLTLAGQRHPAVQTWVQVDERCAAFFALGMARATQTPVALVGTSGSAPGHWHPAVIEADMNAFPLLLISADRPPELQGCGANQTIDQLHLFGQSVRAFHALPVADTSHAGLRYARSLATRAVHQSQWPLPGPVHMNVPFDEPLVPQRMPELVADPSTTAVEAPELIPPERQIERIAPSMAGRTGLIVCGPGVFDPAFATSVTSLAATLDCPILADPLSGLRFGSHDRSRVLCRYDAFLDRQDFTGNRRPEWVLRFGNLPVSKSLQQYLASLQDCRHLLVDPFGRWPDPLHATGEMLRATPRVVCDLLRLRAPGPAAASWLGHFLEQEQTAARLAGELADQAQCFEAQMIPALLDALPAGSLLFTGNSLPVRQLDSFSGHGAKPLQLLANRGASGIDGQVSSLLGLAAAAGESTAVAGLIGDLAFYHDMNGLLAADRCKATLVVINNDGGGIFRHLPQAGLEDFERYWLTPTGLDFRHAAELYRLPFQRVTNVSEFDCAFRDSLEQPGVKLIEARVDPQHSVDCQQRYRRAIRNG